MRIKRGVPLMVKINNPSRDFTTHNEYPPKCSLGDVTPQNVEGAPKKTPKKNPVMESQKKKRVKPPYNLNLQKSKG